MVNQAWGIKRNCPKCSAKFYDLNKNPAECPACHTQFDPEAQVKKRVKRKPARSIEDVKAAKALAAAQKKKKKVEGEEDMDMPEFEDLGIIEDMDDLEVLEEVEVPTKTVAEEDETDEEAFLEDGGPIDEEAEDDDEK